MRRLIYFKRNGVGGHLPGIPEGGTGGGIIGGGPTEVGGGTGAPMGGGIGGGIVPAVDAAPERDKNKHYKNMPT